MKISEKTKRRFRYGTNSLILTAVVIVITVILNILLEKLPLTFDLTAQKLYTLSEDSVEILDEVKKNGNSVEIIALYDKVKGEADSNKSVVMKMLSKYESYDNITVKYVNTDKDPSFVVNTVGADRAKSYSKGDYIIKSGNNIKRVAADDMYEINWYTGEVTGFKIEKSVTSAILHVTSENIPKVYVSTGFGESSISKYTSLTENIQYMNYEIDSIDLTKEEIPEDAKVILFIGPKKDLSMVAYDNLVKWFEEGGHNAFFLMDYDSAGTNLDNFNKVFDMFNLRINNDIIHESEKYHLSNLPMRFEAKTKTAGSLEQLAERKILIFETRSIELLNRTNDYVKANAIIVSSSEAKSLPISEGQTNTNGIVGTHVLAATATYTKPEQSSKIFVTGSSLNVRDDYVQTYPNNEGGFIMLYTLQWMHYSFNRASTIPTVSSSSGNAIAVTDSQKDMIGVFSIFVWPAAIILTGGVIWMRRRHL